MACVKIYLAAKTMNSIDLEALEAAATWFDAGHEAFLATVVHTWGSAPRPVGSMMVLRGDGHVRGSVSGGCIEDDLIQRAREGEFKGAVPYVLEYGAAAEEAHQFGLPCGGTIKLVLERITQSAWLHTLLNTVRQKGHIARKLDMRTGITTLHRASSVKTLQCNNEFLVTVHGPRHRLIIIGAGQLSRHVATMALTLDYEVTVCDPRSSYLDEWDVPGVTLTREMPDDLVLRLRPDNHCAVLSLTHDPKLDDMALLEALKSPAFYVGAIGSQRNNGMRRQRLALFDLTPDEIGRLHGPVGLYLGSRTPPEIAISILAELTAIRNGIMVLQRYPPPLN